MDAGASGTGVCRRVKVKGGCRQEARALKQDPATEHRCPGQVGKVGDQVKGFFSSGG